uniref:Uncharacterized protein n=1 Tax=Triticum urartu TaxID=4572 RepID=A0A8R7VII0_TRIUA
MEASLFGAGLSIFAAPAMLFLFGMASSQFLNQLYYTSCQKHSPLDPTRNIKTKWDIIEWTSDGHVDKLAPTKDQENNRDAKRQPFGFKDINNMAYEDLNYCSFSSTLKCFGS